MAQPLNGMGTAPRFLVALTIQPQAQLEPKSWEVGASSFLVNTSRWATRNKTPSASRRLKNQLLKEQERWPRVTEEEERKPQYLWEYVPKTQLSQVQQAGKPHKSHQGSSTMGLTNQTVSRSPLQKLSIHVSVPWIICYKKFSVSSSVLNCNSVHYIQKMHKDSCWTLPILVLLQWWKILKTRIWTYK